MKKYVAIIASLLVLVVLVTPVFAVETTSPSTSEQTTKLETKTAMKAEKETTQTANLQARASQEIDRRISALTEIIKKIAAMKKLGSIEKTTLTTQVQAEITNLTILKTKIAADTDDATLKADVKSVVTAYRVFALFIPKMHLLAAADVMGTTIDKLTEIATKLDARIKEAEAAGKSVASLKTSLTDMQAKIADAKKQYESIITNVTPLTPDGYPGNKTTLTNARELLKTGRQNLDAAAKDAKTIMTSLKAFRPSGGDKAKEASTSVTPSTTK
ncbi:hypothetical protein BH11PAT1_BH11PAT1_0360 [soil metagenome]